MMSIKYRKLTEREFKLEVHYRELYKDKYFFKYIDLKEIPTHYPDGMYLFRKSKYKKELYIKIDGLVRLFEVNPLVEELDKFKPNPIHIFTLNREMRTALIKCKEYLKEDMQYEVRFLIKTNNESIQIKT